MLHCARCGRDVVEPPSEEFAEAVRALDRVGVRVSSCLQDWPEIKREEGLVGVTAARVLEIMTAEASHDHDQLGRGLSLSHGGLAERRVRATRGHCSVAHLVYSTALGLVQAAGQDAKHHTALRDALRTGAFAARPPSRLRRLGDDGGGDQPRLPPVYAMERLGPTPEPPSGSHYYHGCHLANGVIATIRGVSCRVFGHRPTSPYSDFGQRLYLHVDWNAAVQWARGNAGEDDRVVVLVFNRAVLDAERTEHNGMDLSPHSQPSWQEVVDSFRAEALPPTTLPEGCDWLAGAIARWTRGEGGSWRAEQGTYQLAVGGNLLSVADRALVEVVVVEVPPEI